MGEVADGRMRAAKPPSRQEIVVQEPEASDALARVVVDAALEVPSLPLEPLGLLVNFGERRFSAGCRRLVLTR
jgi:hypothetical protein